MRWIGGGEVSKCRCRIGGRGLGCFAVGGMEGGSEGYGPGMQTLWKERVCAKTIAKLHSGGLRYQNDRFASGRSLLHPHHLIQPPTIPPPPFFPPLPSPPLPSPPISYPSSPSPAPPPSPLTSLPPPLSPTPLPPAPPLSALPPPPKLIGLNSLHRQAHTPPTPITPTLTHCNPHHSQFLGSARVYSAVVRKCTRWSVRVKSRTSLLRARRSRRRMILDWGGNQQL
jgi:hypothetical protein